MSHSESSVCHDVIVIDDDPDIRAYLSDAIETEEKLNLCALGATLEQGLELLTSNKPRVMLVDLGLPDGSGLELIEAASQYSEVDTMVISLFGDEQHVIGALKRGAKGYILKDSLAETINSEILTLIDGGSPISSKIARYLLKQFESHSEQQSEAELKQEPKQSQPELPPSEPPSNNTEPDDQQNQKTKGVLTRREVEILKLVANGYKRHEIAAKTFISIDTVSTHINHIYKKLVVKTNIEAIRKGTDLGIL